MADQLIPPLSLPVLNERGLLDTRWAAFVRMLADAVNGTTGVVETRASYPSGLTIAGVASNASTAAEASVTMASVRSGMISDTAPTNVVFPAPNPPAMTIFVEAAARPSEGS
mgnify:CR=1 FL=1